MLPFANRKIATTMTWQAEADMWFRMPSGYVIVPARNGRPRYDVNPNTATRAFGAIQSGLPPPKLTGPGAVHWPPTWPAGALTRCSSARWSTRAPMLRFLTDLLGRRPALVDGVYLWRDPVVHMPPAPART